MWVSKVNSGIQEYHRSTSNSDMYCNNYNELNPTILPRNTPDQIGSSWRDFVALHCLYSHPPFFV
jgi:hypothetical protein